MITISYFASALCIVAALSFGACVGYVVLALVSVNRRTGGWG